VVGESDEWQRLADKMKKKEDTQAPRAHPGRDTSETSPCARPGRDTSERPPRAHPGRDTIDDKDGPEGEQVDLNEDDDENDEDLDKGKREVRKFADPKLPTDREVKEHYVSGHMPFRSWCHHCVRGRGREQDHRRKKEDHEQGIPEYHMDYCFPGDEKDNMTVLVVVERYSKMKKAVTVPSKGSTGSFAASRVLDLIKECGDDNRDIIVKTDQENAIRFLVDDVCAARTGARTIAEMVPKGSKGSNGIVERAVQSVEMCLRTLKSSLDERMRCRISVLHPINTWLCEYVSYMMNRMEVGSDGKAPYERIKGKRCEVPGLEFGERVLYKHHGGKRMEKINPRWGFGMFVGVRARSNELVVIDGEVSKVVFVRTVRRVPQEQRWDIKHLEWVVMVPWNLGKEDKEADGDLPEFNVKAGPGRVMSEADIEDIKTSEAPRIVHRAHLRRQDFDRHGYTDRCGGCAAMLRNLKPQPHTSDCRERMEKILATDIRVKNARLRLQERGTKLKAMNTTDDDNTDTTKRRRLDELEQQAMTEDDPDKLNDIFERYRKEYLEARANDDHNHEAAKRLKTDDGPVLREAASGSQDPAQYVEMEVSAIIEDGGDPWEITENTKLWSKNTGEYLKTLEDHDVDHTAKIWSSDYDECLKTLQEHSDDNTAKIWSDECLKTLQGHDFQEEFAWDDVNDIRLPLELVRKARAEEMSHMKGKIFKVVKKAEAWARTGRAPISTKWVDTDKTHGTGEPVVRSRWVARDFKDPCDKDREDLFSATPPLEMLRLVLSRQATIRPDGLARKTMYLDIKKAHLAPLCQQDVYVDLPEEANVNEDECGKLIHWLYGCRPAAQAWEEHYSALLVKHGFKRLKAVPVMFVHSERDMVGVVHGDDFVWEGTDDNLDWVLKVLEAEYELKNRGRLGLGEKDVRQIDMLGRVIKIDSEGISWKGDPRHRDLLFDYFGMNAHTKVLTKNGYEDDGTQGGNSDDTELNKEEARRFRMLAARLNYMAQDNPLLQFPAKEACRNMARPRVKDFAAVKRLVRFILGSGEVEFRYIWQNMDMAEGIVIFVDSDWAGCRASRKSTSGGVIKIGAHVIKTWSSTQPTIATSSGEAELIAMYDGAARGLGLKSVLKELGMSPDLCLCRLCTDSSAAKAFVSTRGLGRMRHVEVKLLWLQELVQKGRIRVSKVSGATNVADALTKYHSVESLFGLLAKHGVQRAASTAQRVGPRGGVEHKGQPRPSGEKAVY
jgi:hypothetical protein